MPADQFYTAVIVKDDSVSVTIDGQMTTVPFDAANFEPLCSAVRRQAPSEEIRALLTPAKAIETFLKDSVFEIRVEKETSAASILLNGKEVQSQVSDMILEHFAKGEDVTAIKNFFVKAMQNQSLGEVDVLFNFVTNNKLPIHPDGDILCFKATRANGYDQHSGTVLYKIGEYVTVVNADRNKGTQCSTGLHIGGRQYVKGFARADSMIFVLKVNPADAIYFKDHNDNGKMRVSKVFVYGATHRDADLEYFLPALVAHSPEGDKLQEAADKHGVQTKNLKGENAKTTRTVLRTKDKAVKKAVAAVKKEQTFVSKSAKQISFTTKTGQTYTAEAVLAGVKASGQNGFARLIGIARTTLQNWLSVINGNVRAR